MKAIRILGKAGAILFIIMGMLFAATPAQAAQPMASAHANSYGYLFVVVRSQGACNYFQVDIDGRMIYDGGTRQVRTKVAKGKNHRVLVTAFCAGKMRTVLNTTVYAPLPRVANRGHYRHTFWYRFR